MQYKQFPPTSLLIQIYRKIIAILSNIDLMCAHITYGNYYLIMIPLLILTLCGPATEGLTMAGSAGTGGGGLNLLPLGEGEMN